MERNDNFIWLLAAMPTTVAFHFNCEAIIFTPLQPFVLLCELCAFRTFGSVEQLASRKAPQ
jgi:hypothetical protein